jgi:hypothetical protein
MTIPRSRWNDGLSPAASRTLVKPIGAWPKRKTKLLERLCEVTIQNLDGKEALGLASAHASLPALAEAALGFHPVVKIETV